MKYAVVVIAAPERTDDIPDSPFGRWRALVHTLTTSAAKGAAVEYMRPSVWQIPLHSDLAFLGELIQTAKEHQIPIRVLMLPEKPEWISSPDIHS